MRVLLAVYRDSEASGGSVRVAEVIAVALLRKGVDVQVVVAYGGEGRLAAAIGERCHFMRADGATDLPSWIAYRRLTSALMPDVIHYVDNVAWMMVAAFGLGISRVCHLHFRPDAGGRSIKRSLLFKGIFGTADRTIAISHRAAKDLVSAGFLNAERVRVIYNAVDSSYLNSVERRSEDGRCVLGMAVRLVSDKGVEEALSLLLLLPSQYVLRVAGDGPEALLLKEKSEKMGLVDRVSWLGSVSDIADFYSGIDFYLFMSWYEGFGLSVAEAMFLEKPVVGLLGDGEIGAPDFPLVTDQNSLLIKRSRPKSFSPENDEAVMAQLAQNIQSLWEDSEWSSSLRRNGRNWIESRFLSDRYVAQLLDVYSDLVSDKRRL